MRKKKGLIIPKGTPEDIQSARELKQAINSLLETRGFENWDFKTKVAPKYSEYKKSDYKGNRTTDFVLTRNQLFSDIRAENPRLVIFLASSRDKLMEQTCSVLSHVENFDCYFIYLFFGKDPGLKIHSGKGMSIPYLMDDKYNAIAICDYLWSLDIMKKL